MSRYLPLRSVQRETYRQVARRLHIERTFKDIIAPLKEVLKTRATVVNELMAIGLTEKHAISLNNRLQFLNQQEEKLKGEAPPVVDPKAIQETAKSLDVAGG